MARPRAGRAVADDESAGVDVRGALKLLPRVPRSVMLPTVVAATARLAAGGGGCPSGSSGVFPQAADNGEA